MYRRGLSLPALSMARVHGAGSLGLQAVKGEPPAQAAKHGSGKAGAKQEAAHHVPPRRGDQVLIEIVEPWPASAFTEDHCP